MKRILAILGLICVFGGAILVINPFKTEEPVYFIYESSADGYAGKVNVTVSFDDAMTIKVVEVAHENETQGIGSNAIDQLPALIVEANGVDVDVIAGATVTSTAIIEAVSETIKIATSNKTVEAIATGYAGEFSVFIKFTDGVMTEITIGENSETQGIGSNAIEQLPALIVENGSTDIDVIAGATVTSNGILEAVATIIGE